MSLLGLIVAPSYAHDLERLCQMTKLKDDGLITDEEFMQKGQETVEEPW